MINVSDLQTVTGNFKELAYTQKKLQVKNKWSFPVVSDVNDKKEKQHSKRHHGVI